MLFIVAFVLHPHFWRSSTNLTLLCSFNEECLSYAANTLWPKTHSSPSRAAWLAPLSPALWNVCVNHHRPSWVWQPFWRRFLPASDTMSPPNQHTPSSAGACAGLETPSTSWTWVHCCLFWLWSDTSINQINASIIITANIFMHLLTCRMANESCLYVCGFGSSYIYIYIHQDSDDC